eukprot:scaffold25583_cov37-Phaeocystis_antarctica.AAC.2
MALLSGDLSTCSDQPDPCAYYYPSFVADGYCDNADYGGSYDYCTPYGTCADYFDCRAPGSCSTCVAAGGVWCAVAALCLHTVDEVSTTHHLSHTCLDARAQPLCLAPHTCLTPVSAGRPERRRRRAMHCVQQGEHVPNRRCLLCRPVQRRASVGVRADQRAARVGGRLDRRGSAIGLQ